MKNYEDVVEEVKNYEDVVEASPGDVSGALIAVHDSDLLDLLILHGSHSAISTVRQCHQYCTSRRRTGKERESVCVSLGHKQPLGFFVWTARRAIALPACGVLIAKGQTRAPARSA